MRLVATGQHMKLLPKGELVTTSSVDHAEWNYRPVLAQIIRRRYALVLALMPRHPVHRILEIGFGSGIFLPELARRCQELYGIDVHQKVAEVQAHLKRFGVSAALSQQDATHTSFPDTFFDTIVAVSVLEFIENIQDAARELSRLLTPSGRLIVVMPGKSPLLDFALRIVTGEDAHRDFGTRREQVLPALQRYFRVLRVKRFAPVYTAYELGTLVRG
jgi:ubiquinone/menaquinone biosynthesis C-methylase UbiE